MTPKKRPRTAAVHKDASLGQSKGTYESYFRTLGNLLDQSVVSGEPDNGVLRLGKAATAENKPKAKKLRRRPDSSVGAAEQQRSAPRVSKEGPKPRRILSIPLGAIEIPAGRRARANVAVVNLLVPSIERRGLLSPIRLQPGEDPDKYRLICGLKRFLAHEVLARTHIDAIVVDGDPTQLELDEIEENLVRHDLTVLERAECERRQKELYLILHPDSHQGTAGARARHGLQTTHVSFAASQAAPGSGQRMVERRIQIAKALSPESKALLAETHVADNFTQLLELSRRPEGARHAIASLIAKGKAKSVRAAERQLAAGVAVPINRGERLYRSYERLTSSEQGTFDELHRRRTGNDGTLSVAPRAAEQPTMDATETSKPSAALLSPVVAASFDAASLPEIEVCERRTEILTALRNKGFNQQEAHDAVLSLGVRVATEPLRVLLRDAAAQARTARTGSTPADKSVVPRKKVSVRLDRSV